jgi:hypothetical protein
VTDANGRVLRVLPFRPTPPLPAKAHTRVLYKRSLADPTLPKPPRRTNLDKIVDAIRAGATTHREIASKTALSFACVVTACGVLAKRGILVKTTTGEGRRSYVLK